MSNWRLLLSRTVTGLEQLEQQGQAVPEWVLGGGTALMLHANHRLSKDIDAFIDDPQYLGIMSPKVTEAWSCRTWDETAHYFALKKMHYRPTMLKPRDIFDIAVVDSIDHDALVGNLSAISDKKSALIKRLDNVDRKFLQAELAELDIQAGWDDQKKNCLDTTRSLVKQIP